MIMIDRLYNLGVVPPWEQHRNIVPALIGAAAALGGSIYSNMRSRSNALEMLERQNKRQDYLSANAALLHRQSMSKAGLNINADIGYPTVTAPQGTPAQATAPDFTSSLQALLGEMSLKQSAPKIAADAKKTEADAEKQEIENKLIKRELNIAGQGDENKGYDDIAGMNYQIRVNDYQNKLSQFSADSAENDLRALVANKQIKDAKVVDALVDMPYRQFRVLFNQSKELAAKAAESKANKDYIDSKKLTEDLERKMLQDSNIHSLIDKYMPDTPVRDVVHALAILFSAVTGRVSASIHN